MNDAAGLVFGIGPCEDDSYRAERLLSMPFNKAYFEPFLMCIRARFG